MPLGAPLGPQLKPPRVEFTSTLDQFRRSLRHPVVRSLLDACRVNVHEFKGMTCLGRKWEEAAAGLHGRRPASPFSMPPFVGRWTTMPTALPARRALASSLCSPRPRSVWLLFAPVSLLAPQMRRPAWRPPPRTPPRTPLITALRMVPLTAVS